MTTAHTQAERAMLARGPYDVANLGRLFGLSAGAAKQALGSNCRAAVVHGKTRRTVKGRHLFFLVQQCPSGRAAVGGDGACVCAQC